MALLTDLTICPTFDQAKKKKKLEKINSKKDPMNELLDSLPATILEQRLLFFSWLPSSFSINSFSEPIVKVIDTKLKSCKKATKICAILLMVF
jgi:hypothetical protein